MPTGIRLDIRSENEIEHGRKLASGNAELIWGWATPAGQLRAKRRGEVISAGTDLGPGRHVLEIGCGTGLFTEMFAETGATIIAVDISHELIEIARERHLPQDRVTFLVKRFEDCDVDGPFDAVIGSSVLHHLDMVAAIPRIFSLLRPGGWFSFAEPNLLNPQILVQKKVPWIKRRLGDSPDETALVRWRFAKQLRDAGFVDVRITPFDWLHPITPRVLIPAVRAAGLLVEKIPLLREFSGSVHVRAMRPNTQMAGASVSSKSHAPIRWLAHPLTRGMSIDDPRTTDRRRDIIRSKKFLRKMYGEWYRDIAAALPAGNDPVLELGSGGGFLRDFVPNLITSDVFCCAGVKLVLDGHRMPLADAALRGIAMTNVLHHLSKPREFFAEAARVCRPGAAVAMIEPWVSPWSHLIHKKLHYELFDPRATDWNFPPAGPLSGANGAMPWILFQRDRAQFEREFPQWKIRTIKAGVPFVYLLSGGVSMRSLMPGWSYRPWRAVETTLSPLNGMLAVFARIVLVRTRASPNRA